MLCIFYSNKKKWQGQNSNGKKLLLKEDETNEQVSYWGPGAALAHRGCPGQLGTSCLEDLSLPSLPTVPSQTPYCHLGALVVPTQGELSGCQGH